MRIALCDVERTGTLNTKQLIYEYANHLKLDILVDVYFSGESLLLSKERYNLIILGYNLEGINGLETALELRRQHINSSLIFITDTTSFILDSFMVTPFRFLVKPISRETLFSALNDFFKKFGSDYPLWIKHIEGVVCLNTNDIFYLEADNKHCYVTLKNEKLSCHKTMAKVYESLPKNHFQKINRAYIVNLNYISRYSNENLLLSNGHKLPISRNYLSSFKNEFRNFINPRIP